MRRVLLSIFTALTIGARSPAQTVAPSLADSVFDAELMKLLVQQSQRAGARTFPSLTLTAQYSRHRPFDDQPVYQRGPYELAEQIFRSAYQYHFALNAESRSVAQGNPDAARSGATALLAPAVPMRSVAVAPSPIPWYITGMYVRAPQVGETPSLRDAGGEYFVRVAGIPVKYESDTLWLLALLQRTHAVAVDGEHSRHDNPVVYKKLVYFHGGESLVLQIPQADPSDETIEEVTLSHETPQGFGLAQNVPEPMDKRTMFAYALPSQSTVSIAIVMPDGSPVDTIVHSVSEAGVYRCVWDAGSHPAGPYLCSMEARPSAGGAAYIKQVTFTRDAAAPVTHVPIAVDSLAELFPIATIPLEQQRGERMFRLLVEGGASYLLPQKASSPFDNMFSHVAIGLGFAINKTFEAGVLFGQDGFHSERSKVNPLLIPSSDEVVETRIVPWAGGYGRIHFSNNSTHGFFHASFSSAAGGIVTTFGVGFAVTISSGLSLFVMPHRTDQWTEHISTKWGADYGIAFLF